MKPLTRLAVLLFSAALLMGTGKVAFADTIDQSFTGPDNLAADINECCAFIGQTYTAGLTGTLAGVSVDITERVGDNFPLQVQIRSVASGLPTSTILGETTTTAFGLSDIIAFSGTIPQVAGVQYAIVVDFPGAPAPGPGQYVGIWTGTPNNLYPGGSSVLSLNGGATWAPNGEVDNDTYFTTHVNTVPEPPSALLLGAGLLTLGIWFRRRLAGERKGVVA
jgi:hypothetical protein